MVQRKVRRTAVLWVGLLASESLRARQEEHFGGNYDWTCERERGGSIYRL